MASLYSQSANVLVGQSISTSLATNAGDTVIVRVAYTSQQVNAINNMSMTVNGIAATLVGTSAGSVQSLTFAIAPSGSSGSTTYTGANVMAGTWNVVLSPTQQTVPMVFNGSGGVSWSTAITPTATTTATVYYSTAYATAAFVAQNVASGPVTCVGTLTGASNFLAIAARDYTGVVVNSFQSYVSNSIANLGSTVNNAAVSAPITTTGSTLLSAFIWDSGSSGVTALVGTTIAWNGDTACWSGTNSSTANTAQGEWITQSLGGTYNATWTLSSGNQYSNFAADVIALKASVQVSSATIAWYV